MGLYIKAIDMPKNGMTIVFSNGYAACYDLDGNFLCDAAAIEVPPHGNLIEKHDVFRLISTFPEVDKLLTVGFMESLYNLPTVIPAEDE